MESNVDAEHDYLRRLPEPNYCGQAYVHWSMTIDDRKRGWLAPNFFCKFREILTHTMFRYALSCPIYCCMPDHIHLLWVGILDRSDQRKAAKFFRQQLNLILPSLGYKFQKQAHDHVLHDEERELNAFETIVEYIARNPERAGIVRPDGYRHYPYTGCLIPGYPELIFWQEDYWDRFCRIQAYLSQHGLFGWSDAEP